MHKQRSSYQAGKLSSECPATVDLERMLQKACDDLVVHGAVVAAKSSDGTFEYSNAFGRSSLAPGDGEKSMTLDSVFLLASCTKLVTSIAALQCVERGLITLDEDVHRVVPELTELEILDKFTDSGEATTKKRTNTITLRHLLTHTSGLGYDLMTPKLMRYRTSIDQIPGQGKTLLQRFGIPLVFEPGTSWGYGASLDWAGRIVERLNGQSLEDYFKENIWQQLGITDMTFFLDRRPDLKARLAGPCIRDDDSGMAVEYGGPILRQSEECLGGQGLYGTIPEYLKIIHSLVRTDETLLRGYTIDQLFSPQLPAASRQFLNKLRDVPAVWNTFPGHFPRHIELDWGLGGMLMRTSDPGWRRKNSTVWSGFPNLFWFMDREAGICGVFGTQILPPGDEKTNRVITAFEQAMYRMSRAGNPKI